MKTNNVVALALLAVGFTVSARSFATDWPQFRGGLSQGVAHRSNPSEGMKILWKVAVPGSGWSQPIVFDKTIYLTSAVADPPIVPKNFAKGVADPRSMPGSKATPPDVTIAYQVIALDVASGKDRWKRTAAGKPKYPIHPSNTYATETPAADATGVFAFFGGSGTVAAFSHGGQLLWTRELGAHPTDENFGTGSSPVAHDGKIYVQCFNKDQAFTVCLSTQNGEDLWRVERETAGTSWSTPLVWKNRLRTELVVSGQKLMTSHDPSTGTELWRIAGINVPSTASIAANHETIFFGYRSPFSAGPLYAVNAGAEGDISPTAGSDDVRQQRWFKKAAAPGMPTPLLVNDCLYVLNNSVLTCHDARTGDLHYKQRLPGMATIAASPVAVDDRLLIVDENGKLLRIVVGPIFSADGGLELNDVVWATPAVADGQLFVRGVNHLYSLSP